MRGPLLIEAAIDEVVELCRKRLNMMIEAVQGDHLARNNGDDEKITLELVSPDRYHISEQLEPLRKPCVFVLDDTTRMPLSLGQNITHSLHAVNVSIVVEDTTTRRLVRKTWRYARAMYLTLHDQQTANLTVLVDRFVYGPMFSGGREGRTFTRDITLGVRLMHFEDF